VHALVLGEAVPLAEQIPLSLLELLPARGELARDAAVLGAAPAVHLAEHVRDIVRARLVHLRGVLGRVRQRRGHQAGRELSERGVVVHDAPALELVRQRGRGSERIAHDARALRDPALRRGFEAREL